MVSNCGLYPLKPLDPEVDPAYRDGPLPFRHRANHAGEIVIEWPVGRMPNALLRQHQISIEALEAEIERQAEVEEKYS
jgi:hypothetical protein